MRKDKELGRLPSKSRVWKISVYICDINGKPVAHEIDLFLWYLQ